MSALWAPVRSDAGCCRRWRATGSGEPCSQRWYEQLKLDDVERRGLSELASTSEPGARIREVTALDPAAGHRSVAATVLAPGDPLATVDGITNYIRLEVDPLGEVSISGREQGPELAGQGVFSDVIALARQFAAR